MRKYVTVPQFVEQVRGIIGRVTVYSYIKSGQIPSVRIGSKILVPEDVLDQLFEQQSRNGKVAQVELPVKGGVPALVNAVLGPEPRTFEADESVVYGTYAVLGEDGAIKPPGLGARLKKVLRLRYGLDGERPHTLREVADSGVGQGYQVVSRERVRQMEARALRRLRYAYSRVSVEPDK